MKPQTLAPAIFAVGVMFFAVLGAQEAPRATEPGTVLARRLSNAEFNYTIRDLTGVDIEPTREFPVDPSNTEGFDNSGESLVMSPALLNKYLKAVRDVAGYMVLKPSGFAFAPHPMLSEADREKYCVQQIIDLYHRQDVDYADYFEAAWRFKHRAALGTPRATLAGVAAERGVSAKYLATIWSTLEEAKADVGPLVKLQAMWRQLPAADARKGAEQMRDYVVQLRKKIETRFLNIDAGKVNAREEPLLIWKDQQYASHRRAFDPAQLQVEGEIVPPPVAIVEPAADDKFGPGRTRLVKNVTGDPDLVVPAGQRARYEAAFAKFASVFPDTFYMEERGRNYFDLTQDRGRYLNAGFHNLTGFFRDDQPLYDLVLDGAQQKQLDAMWVELDFVASANIRTYVQFYLSGNRETRAIIEKEGEQGKDITSEARIRQLLNIYLGLARGGDPRGITAIENYFRWAADSIHAVEKARLDAEPSHVDALVAFAARAYRRPLTRDERDDLVAQYRTLRDKDGLTHEDAIRESIVGILMSPDFCYRIDLVDVGIQPVSEYDLASRLSYFLWSSMPDDKLLAHAAAGDLHRPAVIAAETRRMLQDRRVRALAVEFGGNWLDFRRFEDLTTVDRKRFASFTNELRDAMFEEPVHFLVDVFQRNRPVLDLLYAKDTFVNPALAKHYGMPPVTGGWVRVEDADRYNRGGILPMAAFLTKNAPGLRTSPVKRGNWVVKNVLGERITPPPPVVPELPNDEAKLELSVRDTLARHRSNPFCAACHARFDSFGLVFEGFGPVGERRDTDLAGRPIDASATFAGGRAATGVAGLREFIREQREKDFVDNLCRKLLAYALGRSLTPADDGILQDMRRRLAASGYRIDSAIEGIVTSRSFLTKRGLEELAKR